MRYGAIICFLGRLSVNLFQVEKILEKRTQKGGYTEYLVKWRNYEVALFAWFCFLAGSRCLKCDLEFLAYSSFLTSQQDPEENTWEPLDNLGEAEKAIKLYEKEQVTIIINVVGKSLAQTISLSQELKGHAAAKAQGQNNKRTYAKVIVALWIYRVVYLTGPPPKNHKFKKN